MPFWVDPLDELIAVLERKVAITPTPSRAETFRRAFLEFQRDADIALFGTDEERARLDASDRRQTLHQLFTQMGK
ncbi:MAG: hypothetical protein AB1806_13935 [Acidobacteriota bacterium]